MNHLLESAASASSLLFYSTMLMQAYHVHRLKHTESGQVNSTLCVYFNAALWCKYGLLANDNAVFMVNAFGMLTSMILLAVLYMHCADKGGMEKVLWKALSVFAVFGYAVYQGWLQVNAVATTVSVLVFSLPLLVLYKRLRLCKFPELLSDNDRRNDTNGMLYTAVAGAISCILWTAYGVSKTDRLIIIPNSIGLLFSGIQVYMIILSRMRRRS